MCLCPPPFPKEGGAGGGGSGPWRPRALAHMTGAAGPLCVGAIQGWCLWRGGGGVPVHGLLGPGRGAGGGTSRYGGGLAGSELAHGPRDGPLAGGIEHPGSLHLQAPAEERRDGRRFPGPFDAMADGPSSMSGERGTGTAPASAWGEAAPGDGDSVVGSFGVGGRRDIVPYLSAWVPAWAPVLCQGRGTPNR